MVRVNTLTLKRRDPESGEALSEAATLRATLKDLADELDAAAALKTGVMDSESKAHAMNNQRLDVMQSVAARLRSV